MRESALVKRASVVAIRLEENGVMKTILLNNGDCIIQSLHQVRCMLMRSLTTNAPMWNPIPLWKDLSSMYLFPSEYAINPHREIGTHDSGIAPGMIHPDNIDCSTGVSCKTSTYYARNGNRQNSRSQWVRDQFKFGQIRAGHLCKGYQGVP